MLETKFVLEQIEEDSLTPLELIKFNEWGLTVDLFTYIYNYLNVFSICA